MSKRVLFMELGEAIISLHIGATVVYNTRHLPEMEAAYIKLVAADEAAGREPISRERFFGGEVQPDEA